MHYFQEIRYAEALIKTQIKILRREGLFADMKDTPGFLKKIYRARARFLEKILKSHDPNLVLNTYKRFDYF